MKQESNQTYKKELLIRYGYIPIISINNNNNATPSLTHVENNQKLATVCANMGVYGYTVSSEALSYLNQAKNQELEQFWHKVEPCLEHITHDDLNIKNHILYTNFPQEVLDMDTSVYWLKQLFVYLGIDYDWVREPEKPRQSIDVQEMKPKVLQPVFEPNSVYQTILKSLIQQKTKWTSQQKSDVQQIIQNIIGLKPIIDTYQLDMNNFGFKENGLQFIQYCYNLNLKHQYLDTTDFVDNTYIKNATDVLRWAALLSNQNLRLGKRVQFKNFKRSERKTLAYLLEQTLHIESDIVQRPELFKRLFSIIHPGDYQVPKLHTVYHKLYNKKIQSLNSQIEYLIDKQDEQVIDLLKDYPGHYLRQFHQLYNVLGQKAIDQEVITCINSKQQSIYVIDHVLSQLNLKQLIQFKGYINSINERKQLIYAPNGQWKKAKIVDNNKIAINKENKNYLIHSMDYYLKNQLSINYPEGFDVSGELSKVKLPSNNQQLADYGQGTVFDLPDHINFIRTSSYWDIEQASFLDNTWNFFDENWNPIGVCCWDNERLSISSLNNEDINIQKLNNKKLDNEGAVFSGDAVNTQDGGAAQLVDIYLDQLEQKGIRYAIWSSLSFSNIPFNLFKKAHMGLQMGYDAQQGQQFDPARVTMAFSLSGNSKAKIMAYIDIQKRQLIYTDVDYRLKIQSGGVNQERLAQFMPAYIEYLNSLPSVYDLLEPHSGSIRAVYSDANVTIGSTVDHSQNESQDKPLNKPRAYVFKQENQNNQFDPIIINDLLIAHNTKKQTTLYE